MKEKSPKVRSSFNPQLNSYILNENSYFAAIALFCPKSNKVISELTDQPQQRSFDLFPIDTTPQPRLYA